MVSRLISQSEYGLATLSVTLGMVLSVAMGLGISSAIPRIYNSNGSAAKDGIWVTLLFIQVAISFVIVISCIALFGILRDSLSDDFNRFLVPTVLLALVSSLQLTLQGTAIARGASWQMLLATVVQLSVGLGMLPFFTASHQGAGYAYALTIASAGAIAVLMVMKYPHPTLVRTDIRGGLLLSIPFIGQGIATWFLALFDRLVIGAVLGFAELGSYQVAYMLGSVLGMFLEGIQAAWAPQYYRSKRPEKSFLLRRTIRPSLVLAAAMVFTLFCLAPLLSPVIAPGYLIDDSVVAIVALAAFPRALYFISAAKLLENSRSVVIMSSTIASGALTVVGTLVLIPRFGAIGGAIVTLAGFLLQAFIVSRVAFGWRWPMFIYSILSPVLILLPLATFVSWISSTHVEWRFILLSLGILLCVTSALTLRRALGRMLSH